MVAFQRLEAQFGTALAGEVRSEIDCSKSHSVMAGKDGARIMSSAGRQAQTYAELERIAQRYGDYA